MRVDTSRPPLPVYQEPTIVYMLQGMKRGYLAGEIYTYQPGQILVVSLPMQFLCDTVVSNGEPMLALSVPIDIAIVSELVKNIDQGRVRVNHSFLRGMSVFDLVEDSALTLERVFCVLKKPEDVRLLGPALIRELHYHVLQSPAGDFLRSLVTGSGGLWHIHRAIERIRADFAGELVVGTLAKEVAMSISAFHKAFKEVTGHAPLQYLKSVRLHRARDLIIQEGYGASQAALTVGYVSPNQFSREYKRLFGHSPSEALSHFTSHH